MRSPEPQRLTAVELGSVANLLGQDVFRPTDDVDSAAVVRVATQVVRLLHSRMPLELLDAWFHADDPTLGHSSPAEALAAGEYRAVLEAAFALGWQESEHGLTWTAPGADERGRVPLVPGELLEGTIGDVVAQHLVNPQWSSIAPAGSAARTAAFVVSHISDRRAASLRLAHTRGEPIAERDTETHGGPTLLVPAEKLETTRSRLADELAQDPERWTANPAEIGLHAHLVVTHLARRRAEAPSWQQHGTAAPPARRDVEHREPRTTL